MKTRRLGLTLIELMIVIAILGILAAIAIPAYIEHTKQAEPRAPTTEADTGKMPGSQTDERERAMPAEPKGTD